MTRKRRYIFYGIAFVLLILSFYLNLFRIVPHGKYLGHETFEEALVTGRMAKSQKDGIFAASGFTGVNYNKSLVKNSLLSGDQINDLLVRDSITNQFKSEQINYYMQKEETPEDYCVYVSHSGGNALFWYAIQKMLPFDNGINYRLLRLINCMLMSLCFLLFIGWVYRNFGFISSFVLFIFIFLSPWIALFAGNGLWWSLWNFYAPFLTMLLLLEKRYNSSDKVSVKKMLIGLFFAVLIKLFFSGLEFISTAMLTLFIPIIYYAILEKWHVFDFIKLSFKAGLVAVGAIVLQFGMLIIQLRYLLGNYDSAFQYLINAFLRRSSFKSGLSGADLDSDRFADSDSLSFLWNNVIKDFLRGNAFEWGFISLPFDFWYAVLIGIILCFCAIVFFFVKKYGNWKYNALLISTIISVICPLSWFAIFKEHAFWHPQLDFIVWYMPFLLFGFTVIGVGISIFVSPKRD